MMDGLGPFTEFMLCYEATMNSDHLTTDEKEAVVYLARLRFNQRSVDPALFAIVQRLTEKKPDVKAKGPHRGK